MPRTWTVTRVVAWCSLGRTQQANVNVVMQDSQPGREREQKKEISDIEMLQIVDILSSPLHVVTDSLKVGDGDKMTTTLICQLPHTVQRFSVFTFFSFFHRTFPLPS